MITNYLICFWNLFTPGAISGLFWGRVCLIRLFSNIFWPQNIISIIGYLQCMAGCQEELQVRVVQFFKCIRWTNAGWKGLLTTVRYFMAKGVQSVPISVLLHHFKHRIKSSIWCNNWLLLITRHYLILNYEF